MLHRCFVTFFKQTWRVKSPEHLSGFAHRMMWRFRPSSDSLHQSSSVWWKATTRNIASFGEQNHSAVGAHRLVCRLHSLRLFSCLFPAPDIYFWMCSLFSSFPHFFEPVKQFLTLGFQRQKEMVSVTISNHNLVLRCTFGETGQCQINQRVWVEDTCWPVEHCVVYSFWTTIKLCDTRGMD